MRTKLTLGRKTLSPLQPTRDHHLQQLVRRPVPEPGSSCLLHHPIALSYQSGYLSTVSIMGCRTHYGLLLSVLVPAAVLVAPDWARADKSPGEAWRRAEMLKRPKGGTLGDPNPRVVLIAGLGLVAAAKNAKEANLSRNFVYRAINVIRGAHALGGYVSLTEEESYAVEYWPLELYKLTLAPPPEELAGRVAFVTGGAGGIGSAIARSLASRGACVVVCDLDEEGAGEVADSLPEPGILARADVTDEDEVARAYRRAILEYGGGGVVVSNAGPASHAPPREASLGVWG